MINKPLSLSELAWFTTQSDLADALIPLLRQRPSSKAGTEDKYGEQNDRTDTRLHGFEL